MNVLCEVVLESAPKINDKLFANYTFTHYFLLYLLRRAINCDAADIEFAKCPINNVVRKRQEIPSDC